MRNILNNIVVSLCAHVPLSQAEQTAVDELPFDELFEIIQTESLEHVPVHLENPTADSVARVVLIEHIKANYTKPIFGSDENPLMSTGAEILSISPTYIEISYKEDTRSGPPWETFCAVYESI